MGEEVRRISVIFPVSVLEELRRCVPPRERSRFIVEARERALRQRRLAEVLEGLCREPAWSDEDHPGLITVGDVNRYVRRLQEAWMPRSWDEILEEARQNGRSTA